jgi:hypothetical protein
LELLTWLADGVGTWLADLRPELSSQPPAPEGLRSGGEAVVSGQ